MLNRRGKRSRAEHYLSLVTSTRTLDMELPSQVRIRRITAPGVVVVIQSDLLHHPLTVGERCSA